MSNLAFQMLAIILIQSTHSMITSSTNCGDLIIKCQGDIDKCCVGSCCPLLKMFQNQNSTSTPSDTDGEPITYIATPKPEPLICPNIGEECSSYYEKTSRCCDTNTKCRFETYNRNGLLGVCCVLHNTYGCTKDSDCCKYDGICNNGLCQRDLNPNTENTNTNENTNANSNSIPMSAGRARGEIVDNWSNMDKAEDTVDLHEKNRSKPHYDVWVSLTANTIILYLVLLIMCCVFYFWYKKTNKMYERGKVIMNVGHISVQKNGNKYSNNLECDIDESDSTEPESDNDELPGNCDIYSSGREL